MEGHMQLWAVLIVYSCLLTSSLTMDLRSGDVRRQKRQAGTYNGLTMTRLRPKLDYVDKIKANNLRRLSKTSCRVTQRNSSENRYVNAAIILHNDRTTHGHFSNMYAPNTGIF